MINILQAIERVRELSILADAIQITHLDRLLTDANLSFTIFAPNNIAFAKVSGMNLKLLTRDKQLLTEILGIHIVARKLDCHQLLELCQQGKNQISIESIDRSPLAIDLSNGIGIGNARVVNTDNSASNGIIYTIDRVLCLDS
jgi:uncharacterized surface protein with fasciclin (FAS1) repeats